MTKQKLIKPSIKDLRDALAGIVSASLTLRIEAEAKALAWYDDAMNYCITKKLVDLAKLQKSLDLAIKTRELGISSNHPEEKELAFKKSIEFYQKICEGLKPPDVNTFFEQYKTLKAQLEAEEAKLKQRFQPVLDLLLRVFKNTGFKISIDSKAEKDRLFDGSHSIVYSRSAMIEIYDALKREGVMPVILKELNLFSRAVAIERDAQGSFIYKPEKQVKAYQALLADFVEFARSAEGPFKLFRYAQAGQNVPAGNVAAPVSPSQTAQSAPKTPKPPKAPKAPKVGVKPGVAKYLCYQYAHLILKWDMQKVADTFGVSKATAWAGVFRTRGAKPYADLAAAEKDDIQKYFKDQNLN
jgi:hypothetical protein